jgi:5,10-methylenetetrahydromethanopterin reductase
MHTSIYGGADAKTVAHVVQRVDNAAREGWSSIWFSQGATLDIQSALAVAAWDVPDIHLGSAVVPIQGRHPIPLAQQALTVASAAGPGRFTLGVGVSHAAVSEGWYGIPYRGVVDLCAEEIEILAGLLSERTSNFVGRHLVARAALDVEAAAPRLVLGALAPRMLKLAGRYTDGVVTWMTGPKTLREHVIPALTDAAAEAKRPSPAVIASLPISVTSHARLVRADIAESMARTARHSAYRRVIELEKVNEPADIAIIGDESQVLEGLEALVRSGATEILVNAVGDPDDVARTRELLANARI